MTCAPKRETSCVAPTDCAAAAHCVDSLRSIYWLSIMVIEPMATSIYVLNPAGELRRSRSSPSRPPTTTASSILTATDKKLIFLEAN